MDRRELLALLATAAVGQPEPAGDPTITVTPLQIIQYTGPSHTDVLDIVADRIQQTFRLNAIVDRQPQRISLDPPYSARALLEALVSVHPKERRLYITNTPLHERMPSGEVRGVSGYAFRPGLTMAVTTYWRSKGVPSVIAKTRIASVALHEIGHSIGAEDCQNSQCTMYNDPTARNLALDRPLGTFCDEHKILFMQALR